MQHPMFTLAQRQPRRVPTEHRYPDGWWRDGQRTYTNGRQRTQAAHPDDESVMADSPVD